MGQVPDRPSQGCRQTRERHHVAENQCGSPGLSAETTQGNVSFHDWIGDGWAILFSHPKDFTPVCTTELGYMAGLMPEFQRRNCKIIGLSVDPVDNHSRWAKDIEETQGHVVTYPLITILRSGDAVVEFRPSGIKLDAVVLAKGPDLLGRAGHQSADATRCRGHDRPRAAKMV